MSAENPSYRPTRDAARMALTRACESIVTDICGGAPPLVSSVMVGPLLGEGKAWHSETEFIEDALDELIHELGARGVTLAMREGLSAKSG